MTDDQKKALGLGAIGIVGLFLLSRARGGTVKQAVSTTGSIAPYTPQTPIPLPAGESIYDPNSQVLLTTPAPMTTLPLQVPPGTTLPGLGTQTTAPSAPAYSVNVTYPTHVATKSAAKKPTKRVVTHAHRAKKSMAHSSKPKAKA